MSLCEQTLATGEHFTSEATHAVVWLADGSAELNGKSMQKSEGAYLAGKALSSDDGGCRILCFDVSRSETMTRISVGRRLLLQSDFEWPDTDAILRLDQVSFPKGAIAYRHVHPGAGIRYLVKGQLEIRGDLHVEPISTGMAWFEDTNSPVKATASADEDALFVRAMILPLECEGKRTIRYLNAEDADKPRLQENIRFLDQRISI